MQRIGVGVIGLGFIGQAHVRAYVAAAREGFPCRLHAVCDRTRERLSGRATASGNLAVGDADRLFDPGEVRTCTEPDELLADPGVHLVSVCTYTDSHADLATRALKAGKHVLVEKPVAVRSVDVRRLSDVAAASGRLCMPAMCMRFWPGWDWLRDRVRDGSFGAVRSATFQRLGSGPSWAADFYQNEARSGGALFDLHIHDVDFICWCFGHPVAVHCYGSGAHFTTTFRFDGGPSHVAAEGAWDLARAAGFRMRYLVAFEKATAEWDLARSPSLIVHQGPRSEPVELSSGTGYDGQVRRFVEAIAHARSQPPASLEDAIAVTEVLEAAARSRQIGRPVEL